MYNCNQSSCKDDGGLQMLSLNICRKIEYLIMLEKTWLWKAVEASVPEGETAQHLTCLLAYDGGGVWGGGK